MKKMRIIKRKVVIVFFLVVSFLFFCFTLDSKKVKAGEINNYQKYNITYEDLNYEKLTFDRYEQIVRTKSGDTYEIYFVEYDDPFEIDGITQRELDKKQLDYLESGDKVEVYYRKGDSKKYTFEICELKNDDATYLEFSDYLSVNKANEITGLIVCPILILIGVTLSGFFIFISIKLK